MPRKSPKFVTEYLIPSLDSERFGSQLKWINKENSLFQVGWYHKSDLHWSEGKAQVFVEWDKIKGHYEPNKKEYFTRSKQRFRSLLYKLCRDGQIKEIKKDGKKSKRFYYITGVKGRRKRQCSNADSGIFSTEDTYSDDNEMLLEDANNGEILLEDAICDDMNELLNDNTRVNNLDDHNYSKSFIDYSDLEETRVELQEDTALSTFRNECYGTDKKVLEEQNYLYHYNDLNVSKEKYNPTEVLQAYFDEDLQTGSKNSIFMKDNDLIYGLHHYTIFNENTAPIVSMDTFNSLNADIDPVEQYISAIKGKK